MTRQHARELTDTGLVVVIVTALAVRCPPGVAKVVGDPGHAVRVEVVVVTGLTGVRGVKGVSAMDVTDVLRRLRKNWTPRWRITSTATRVRPPQTAMRLWITKFGTMTLTWASSKLCNELAHARCSGRHVGFNSGRFGFN